MPVKQCRSDGNPGFKWGDSGACYTYEAGDDDAKNTAKKKAIRQAIAAGASRRELEGDLDSVGIRLLAEIDEELATEDIDAVEVLAVGGPIKGIGSPAGGEYITKDRLGEIADASRALEEELRQPIKVSHDPKQRLLKASGITDGERPAAGRARNFRLNEAGDRIVADFKKVPKILARLMRAGAYTRVSAELVKPRTSQGTGEEHGLAIGAVALLGAQLPAVQTLQDVVAQYENADDEETPAAAKPVLVLADGDLVWDPGEGLEALRNAVREALNPGPAEAPMRYWVRDVSSSRALVTEGYGDDGKAWVVPFTRTDTGVELAPSSDWTTAEMAWVEAARELAEKTSDPRRYSGVPELTLTEETQRSLAEKLGVKKVEELSPEKLLEAVDELKTKAEAEPEPKPEGEENGDGDDAAVRALEERTKSLEDELKTERRRAFVEDFVLKSGRAEPGQREQIEAMYDASPDAARKYFESIDPDDTLAREFGSDEDEGPDGDQAKAEDESEKQRIAREYNIDPAEVI